MRLLGAVCRRLYSLLAATSLGRCGTGCSIGFPLRVYGGAKVQLGQCVTLGAHAWLNCLDTAPTAVALKIGDGCDIGRFVHINAYQDVLIEDEVLIGERVHISDCTHHYLESQRPIVKQGASFQAPVRIKRGAWIGSGAVILAGVTIGINAVVGANAVVTKDVPDHHVAVGIPARNHPKKSA